MYANRHDRLGYRLAYSHDENNQWRNRDSLAYRANRFNGMVEYRLWNQANIRVEGGINDTNRLDAAAETVRIDTPNTQSYARIGYEQEDFFVRAFWSRQDATVDFNPVTPLSGILSVGDADGESSPKLVEILHGARVHVTQPSLSGPSQVVTLVQKNPPAHNQFEWKEASMTLTAWMPQPRLSELIPPIRKAMPELVMSRRIFLYEPSGPDKTLRLTLIL